MNTAITLYDAFSQAGIHASWLERTPSDGSIYDVGRRRKLFDDAFLLDPLPPHHSEVVSFTFGGQEVEADIFGRVEMLNNGRVSPVNLRGLVHFFENHERKNSISSWNALVCTFVRSGTTGRMWQFLLNGPFLSGNEYVGDIAISGRTICIPVVSS